MDLEWVQLIESRRIVSHYDVKNATESIESGTRLPAVSCSDLQMQENITAKRHFCDPIPDSDSINEETLSCLPTKLKQFNQFFEIAESQLRGEIIEVSCCETKRPDNFYGNREKSEKVMTQESGVNKTSENREKCLRVKFNSCSRSPSVEDNEYLSLSTSITSSARSAEASSAENSSFGHFTEAQPLDGGWGWVIVAAAFMVNLIADGITFSFGVIYVEFLDYFGKGKSRTAWIGSLFMAMPLLSGPVASFLTDRYGCRKVSIAGSILATTGFVISSFTDSLLVLIFTFGVVAGFGLSLCFVAAVVIVAYYFDKRRSFATGLSVCGSGIGTSIFAPLTEYLLAEYGWRGTTLILAGCFLNLAVCGCLMRDLEWTTVKAKAKSDERKKNRDRKRISKIQGSSVESFSGCFSVNLSSQKPHSATGSFAFENKMIIDHFKKEQESETANKLFSSLLTLPTFLKSSEQVPIEVLELLVTRNEIYNVLLQNHPNVLTSPKICNKPESPREEVVSIFLSEEVEQTNEELLGVEASTTVNIDKKIMDNVLYLWLQKKLYPDRPMYCSNISDDHRRLPTAYLKNIRVHRHSLTYRGAMLNINRYHLRASSCPDIYRNSMTTIAKTKFVWYSGILEFRDLLVNMLDFSHFSDSRFLLFAMSNFLLHTWYDVPYVYLTDNAIEMGFDEADASMLISAIGITNMFGEIVLGWAGDRPWINSSIVYALCMVFCGAVTSAIPLVGNNYYALCATAGAFGLFISANYSLTSIILVEVITLERFTNAYGLLLLVQGIANLMGPPLAGWLYDITGTYNLSFYLAGFFISLSGILLMIVPIIDAYKTCIRKKNSEEPNKKTSSKC